MRRYRPYYHVKAALATAGPSGPRPRYSLFRMRRKQEIPRSHAVNLSRKFNPTESSRSVLTLTALETAWRSGAAIGNGQMEGRREKEGGAEEGRIDLVHHGPGCFTSFF